MDNLKNIKPKASDTTILYQGKNYELIEDSLILNNGHNYNHLTLVHPGAVAILPLMGNEILLVEQYRHSIKEVILEIPAGKLEPYEPPLCTAKRELAEETGFGSDQLIDLGFIYPAPGFCSEVLHLFFATNLYEKKLPLDKDEEISVKKVNIDKLESLIIENKINDSKTIVAFFKAKFKRLLPV